MFPQPSRRFVTLGLAGLVSAAQAGAVSAAPARPQKRAAVAAMKAATRFMTDKVSHQGGYVWSYLPDFSRRWGEMEAKPSMIWVQPPGTGTMGHAFLDAYHATGDEQFWKAAEAAVKALIAGQHPSGGWNYLIDTAGDASIKDWYDTVGANGWRLEEFQHYYGNATFDDAGTSEAMQLILRMYLEKREEQYLPALERSIRFVLDSQYPVGGWPQRFPRVPAQGLHGLPDYTGYITFNDDVAGENIKFLVMVYQTLGDARVLDPIKRAMDCFVVTQQPQPQPAWGLQHTVDDLKPAGARSYEPKSFVSHTTGINCASLMTFYELTGDRKYLARIGEALDWIESIRLPANLIKDGREYPTFLEIGTNKPMFLHRRGSNVVNGQYYLNSDPTGVVVHYGSTRAIQLAALRERLARLEGMSGEEASKNSPLKARGLQLPKFFTTQNIEVSDLNAEGGRVAPSAPTEEKVAQLVSGIGPEGYWVTPLRETSHPYAGPGSATPAPGDFSQTRVGDATDTSPYITDNPVPGISVAAFIQNMAVLSQYVGQ